jgi:hypothetical protein
LPKSPAAHDVDYLAKVFPNVKREKIYAVLDKANGDLDEAAGELLRYTPLAPAEDLPKKQETKKVQITMPKGKAVTVVLGAPKSSTSTSVAKSEFSSGLEK